MKVNLAYLSNSWDKIKNWFIEQSKKTLLTRFCERGNIKMIKVLMKLKFNVNKEDGRGKSPLWAAVTSPSLSDDKLEKIINFLSENGADLGKTYNNKILLDYLIDKSRISSIKALINSNKISINYEHEDGKNVLWRLVENKEIATNEKLELIDVLRDNNLDINHADNKGKTVLWQLAKDFNDDKKELLAKLVDAGVDINKRDNEDNSLLVYAIENKDYLLEQVLIANGAKVDIDVDRESEIFISVYYRIMKELLSPEVQERAIDIGGYSLSQLINKMAGITIEEKWVKIIADVMKSVVRDPEVRGRFKNVFKEEYKDVKKELSGAFRTNKIYEILKKNAINMTNNILDNMKTNENISDILLKSKRTDVNKYTNIEKIQILRINRYDEYCYNRIRDIERFFANPSKQEKWKDKVIYNIKFVVNEEKGLKMLSKDRWAKLRENIVDFIKVNKCYDLKGELSKISNIREGLKIA